MLSVINAGSCASTSTFREYRFCILSIPTPYSCSGLLLGNNFVLLPCWRAQVKSENKMIIIYYCYNYVVNYKILMTLQIWNHVEWSPLTRVGTAEMGEGESGGATFLSESSLGSFCLALRDRERERTILVSGGATFLSKSSHGSFCLAFIELSVYRPFMKKKDYLQFGVQ